MPLQKPRNTLQSLKETICILTQREPEKGKTTSSVLNFAIKYIGTYGKLV
jgi:hypothetical protein